MRYISAIPRDDNALPFPRGVAVMGSTGSIGRNALRVAEGMADRLRVVALAGGRNLPLLAEQAARWRPPCLAVRDATGPTGVEALKALLPAGYTPEIFCGQKGYAAMASLPDVDVVLSAQSGAAGLRATVAAAMAGKVICLANKESMVLAGPLLRGICASTGAVILPVDSEHYALFQCMAGKKNHDVERLVLTASGGPFRGKDAAFLAAVRPEDALRHPTWNMGAKITIDSATLMNKGLEVIEACRLYDMPVERVDVVVHPQSLVHSLVAFRDGSLLGQFAAPDMRLPIACCLAWPVAPLPAESGIPLLDLAKAGTLHFEPAAERHFPCLGLARRALAENSTVELNAANEIAVERFLAGDIGFMDIPALVASALDHARATEGGTCPSATPAAVEAALCAIEARDAATRARSREWQRP